MLASSSRASQSQRSGRGNGASAESRLESVALCSAERAALQALIQKVQAKHTLTGRIPEREAEAKHVLGVIRSAAPLGRSLKLFTEDTQGVDLMYSVS